MITTTEATPIIIPIIFQQDRILCPRMELMAQLPFCIVTSPPSLELLMRWHRRHPLFGMGSTRLVGYHDDGFLLDWSSVKSLSPSLGIQGSCWFVSQNQRGDYWPKHAQWPPAVVPPSSEGRWCIQVSSPPGQKLLGRDLQVILDTRRADQGSSTFFAALSFDKRKNCWRQSRLFRTWPASYHLA